MNIDLLKKTDWMMLEAIVGSNLYGLNTKDSDIDHKGIFILPWKELGSMNQIEQVSDAKQDNTYYEIKRFLQLAMKSNPNTLELFYLPKDMILTTSPAYDELVKHKDLFLTKNIRGSLGGYATAQIHKARGKNKKISNPMSKDRKDPMDFCYVMTYLGAKPLKKWLAIQRLKHRDQKKYGLSKLDHTHNTYYMYYDEYDVGFRGILKDGADELRMSSIPKDNLGEQEILYFHSEAYSKYCKEYKEYWEWMKDRNEARFISVEKHGKGYDGKNLMHCFRLLEMGIDAAKTGDLIVKRENKQWLLDVRNGVFEYDDLIKQADERLKEFDEAMESCDLPKDINFAKVDDLLLNLRDIHNTL